MMRNKVLDVTKYFLYSRDYIDIIYTNIYVEGERERTFDEFSQRHCKKKNDITSNRGKKVKYPSIRSDYSYGT